MRQKIPDSLQRPPGHTKPDPRRDTRTSCSSNPTSESGDYSEYERLLIERETLLKNMRTVYETGNKLLAELDQEVSQLLLDTSQDS